MANLIPQIAELLGVELGEEFKLDIRGDDIFQITEGGVWMRKGIDKEEWVEKPFEFVMLCNGDAEVVKLPWKPKNGDTFYSFHCFGSGLKGFGYIPDKSNYTWRVDKCTWNDSAIAFALLKAGWVYRTKKEAEAALPAVAAELGVEYEL